MKNKTKKIILAVCIAVILVLAAVSILYINDYYHASDFALSQVESNEKVNVSKINKNTMVFSPKEKESNIGFIFYPGGKVQYEAYAPLMQELAQNGIVSILVHMPGNLAVLDSKAADGLKEQFPKITHWYIGGHSLGGAMAASYVSKHAPEFDGLVLLGAYSTADISKTDLHVISLYGSNDQVLAKEKYQKNRSHLPESFVEEVIQGGCHSYFGSYGEQDGDGKATITEQEQREFTIKLLASQMKKNSK